MLPDERGRARSKQRAKGYQNYQGYILMLIREMA